MFIGGFIGAYTGITIYMYKVRLHNGQVHIHDLNFNALGYIVIGAAIGSILCNIICR